MFGKKTETKKEKKPKFCDRCGFKGFVERGGIWDASSVASGIRTYIRCLLQVGPVIGCLLNRKKAETLLRGETHFA